MVLSNKKLKQKLREAVTESLASSEAQTHQPNQSSANIDLPKSRTLESLKSLLGSATQKPRLSKREKRRKALSLAGPDRNGDTEEENGKLELDGEKEKGKKKKDKKRKREEKLEGGDAKLEEIDGAEVEEKPKQKKKKKKKKKKKVKKAEVKKDDDVEGTNGGNEEKGVTETIQIPESQEKEDFMTKVYVGGIPYYSTEDDIRSYFDSCGTITEIDCMKFPETGKFRGIAIISFKTEAAAKRALALDGADMGGLFLKIQPYKSSKSSTKTDKVSDFAPAIREGYNKIYIGNLSWDITEDELRKLFSDCSISSIKFGEDKETGEFRGYAHVDFADSLSLNMALKLDQRIVCGRPVRIRCAVPRRTPETKPDPVPATEAVEKTESTEAVAAVSGKIRRRTCYECGEKGHLSSACPNKQAADPAKATAS